MRNLKLITISELDEEWVVLIFDIPGPHYLKIPVLKSNQLCYEVGQHYDISVTIKEAVTDDTSN